MEGNLKSKRKTEKNYCGELNSVQMYKFEKHQTKFKKSYIP